MNNPASDTSFMYHCVLSALSNNHVSYRFILFLTESSTRFVALCYGAFPFLMVLIPFYYGVSLMILITRLLLFQRTCALGRPSCCDRQEHDLNVAL